MQGVQRYSIDVIKIILQPKKTNLNKISKKFLERLQNNK